MNTSPALAILPGHPYALFLLRVDAARQVLVVHAAQFLRGLRLACDVLSFGELQRDELPLDELLPWTGNV